MEERTLMIIKPDAVKAGLIGFIIDRVLKEGFDIRAMKMLHLSEKQARDFYAVHKGKPFYESLVNFVTSGKVVVCALFRENAVEHFRKIIGATDFTKAEPGTIRRMFATSIERNCVHGSDSVENGKIETDFFFDPFEYLS
jgi:nucleoside-diphosphate kinase